MAEEDGDQGRPRDMQRREGSQRRREELQGPETVKSQGGVRGWGGGIVRRDRRRLKGGEVRPGGRVGSEREGKTGFGVIHRRSRRK